MKQNIYRLIKLNLLIMALSLVKVNAQITANAIDSIVNVAIKNIDHTAGFAIGIVKDGKVLHAKGYGVKSVVSNGHVTADTPFGIASNSKAFTSVALSILVDQGKINWEDKVVDYIPEFRMYNDYVTNEFNIQDLLTHRSGLGLGAGDLMIFPDGSNFTIADVLTVFQHFEPVSPFRTKFDYDNLLYLVAGELTARVSGQAWESFVEEYILKPLGMENSYSNFKDAYSNSNYATAHSFDGTSVIAIENANVDSNVKPKMNGAAGGLWSSANDMCKWMLVQLNGGKYGDDLDKVLFSEEQQREMWRIHTAINKRQDPRSPFKVHFSGYGLGWFLSDFNGFLKVEHSGLIPGMMSEVLLFPELNLGIVTMNNSEGAGILNGLLGFILMDEFLHIESGVNWLEMGKGMQNRQQSMGDPDADLVWGEVEANNNIAVNRQIYLGVYEDDWFGRVEIFERGEDLWFRSNRSPKLNGKMSFYKDNTFAINWEYQDMKADAFAIFSVDNNKKAMGLKMKGISRAIDFSFDFQDLDLRRVE